jgi:hypothetical protein
MAAEYENMLNGVGYGNISVYVYDNLTEKPIAGVLVTSGSLSGQTGTDGTFLLSGLNAGSNLVTVSKSGYDTLEAYVTVTVGQTVTRTFPMILTASESVPTSFMIDLAGIVPYTMIVGEERTIYNTFGMSDGTTETGESTFVTYYVSDSSVASLTPSMAGTTITGLKAGKVTLYGVMSFPGRSDLKSNTISVTVT